MMILALAAIWSLGFLVIFTDPKRTSTRWAGATAFVGGFGFFSAVVDEALVPLLKSYFSLQPATEHGFLLLCTISSFICQAGMPYTFLIFAIHSGDLLKPTTKRFLKYAALVPPLLMLLISPVYPVLTLNYWLMIGWVMPYFAVSTFLLLRFYVQEKDPLVKKSRLYTNILVIVPLIFVFTTIYIMRTQNNYDAWRYNTIIVGLQVLLILFISVKYGFLDVKLRVEKRRLNSTLRAMTSGAQIVNHTIKNEVGKITLFADRINTYAVQTNQPDLQEDAAIVMHSAKHILEMMNRIQGQLQDIVLKETRVNPRQLLEQVLHNLRPIADKQHVQIVHHLEEKECSLRCDPVQTSEMLTNLCMNSFEAMKSGGTLNVQMFLSKKHLVVTISDTGSGIAKENLPYVLDPFFSTKKTTLNFGLGLSYCYNVMQKHQGMLEIYSEKDKGTSVFLYFPRKRVFLESIESND